MSGHGKTATAVIIAWTFISALVGSAKAEQGVYGAPATSNCDPDFTFFLVGPTAYLDALPGAAAQADPRAATSSGIVLLHKGVWDFDLTGAHMASVRGKPDRFNAASVGIGYFVADDFSINAALVGYAVSQPDNGAFAAGIDAYARWYFLTVDRVSLYMDVGAGAFLADKEVPDGGTHFNFTPRGGIGVAYRFNDNDYFLFGTRFWHLSNAGIHGPWRNPSFDGIQYYGSIMFAF